MLEQNFTQSDWWVGFELSASEIATQFPTKINKTQTVKTQVDHWWTCIWTLLWYFLCKICWFMFPLPWYLCIHSITLQQRCHIPFLPIGQHHAMAQADARDTRDAELRSFSADGCGKKTMWWSNCNSTQVWTLGECYTTMYPTTPKFNIDTRHSQEIHFPNHDFFASILNFGCA